MPKGKTQTHYDKNPSSRKKKAAYDKKFNARSEQKKRRAKRNKDRATAIKAGRVRKGDSKDIHHANGLGSSKTSVMSASKNRGMPEKSRLKNSKRKKRK